MENAELIKIAIAAAVGAALKETFSALIRSSKSAVAKLAKNSLPLIIKNFLLIDLSLTVFFVILGTIGFLWTPFPNAAVTHLHLKTYILFGAMLTWQIHSLKPTFLRYKNMKRTGHVAAEATATGLLVEGSHETLEAVPAKKQSSRNRSRSR